MALNEYKITVLAKDGDNEVTESFMFKTEKELTVPIARFDIEVMNEAMKHTPKKLPMAETQSVAPIIVAVEKL